MPTTPLSPWQIFSTWYEEATATLPEMQASAMTLATVSAHGQPSARIVLLKQYDTEGLVFYTNLHSKKSKEIAGNAHVALCFYWPTLSRQIRIEGTASLVKDAEADQYFNSRPLISRLGALASAQSDILESRDILEQQLTVLAQRYSDSSPPPRPAHWSGWRVTPAMFEFWEEGEFRLHQRSVFIKTSPSGWDHQLLYP